MSLTSPPASTEAKRLVDSIIDIILSTEQRKRARQPSVAVAFKSAVGLIVGDLLIGLQTREVGWSYLSLSTAAFSEGVADLGSGEGSHSHSLSSVTKDA